MQAVVNYLVICGVWSKNLTVADSTSGPAFAAVLRSTPHLPDSTWAFGVAIKHIVQQKCFVRKGASLSVPAQKYRQCVVNLSSPLPAECPKRLAVAYAFARELKISMNVFATIALLRVSRGKAEQNDIGSAEDHKELQIIQTLQGKLGRMASPCECAGAAGPLL